MKSKKILIVIIIIIIAALAIGGGILAYLFVATDTFKSDKELFSKYISQNIEALQKLENSQTSQIYKNLRDEKKYESNTNIKATYSEGGEISNPLNNLAARLDIQRDSNDQYFYMDGQILFNQEEYLESEIINDKELYGIRFSDVTKQFISIKDDSNLEKVAEDIGTDTATLKKIIEIIDGTNTITDEVITQDEMKTLKEKYLNMIIDTMSNGTFSSNKKSMITYNNNTINAKAYTVNLSSEQIENLIIQILNSIKTETAITKNIKDEAFEEKIDKEIDAISNEKEIPAIKITVYEHSKKTIRTVVEMGEYKIILENLEENGQVKSNMQINKVVSEQTDEYNIELIKESKDDKEDISIDVDVTKGEDKYTLSFLNELTFSDENIELSMTASYKKDILTASIKLENEVSIGQDFEKKVNLDNTNNVTLNDIQGEKRKNIVDVLKSNVPKKVSKRLELLQNALEIKTDEPEEDKPDYDMSQVEINKFNAQFEFYTGNEIAAETVKNLLNVAGKNLGSYEIKLDENQENTNEIKEDKLKYIIRLNIERNKEDKDGINKILEKINDKKKYKVSISYKGENQLIDYIIIEEAEK